ncbi:hypothetical protein [Bacillus stercoris]|uniref:hypothetical protein n=1 Tax=Bacillus stercoris TaxID=2054641 RepID=UPI003CEBC8D1
MVKDIESRIEIFEKVINLAEARRELVDSGEDDTKEDIELLKYVETLNYEDIKVLQTVMYLGRDRDYDKSMSTSEIYRDYRDYFDRKGWKNQKVDAGQMTDKTPMGTYLIDGLKILGFDYKGGKLQWT